MFSTNETICHNLDKAKPGIIACKGSTLYWLISLWNLKICIFDFNLIIAPVISFGINFSFSEYLGLKFGIFTPAFQCLWIASNASKLTKTNLS